MNIFLSWSGESSRVIANALSEWLPLVIHDADPWMSETSIAKGTRWGAQVAEQLQRASVGIVCVTPENVASPWLLFETGALAKTLDATYVCPLLAQLEPSDIDGPLAQFQSTLLESKEDLRRLIGTIYTAIKPQRLSEKVLNTTFDRFWPDLQQTIDSLGDLQAESPETIKRSDRDLIEEVLSIARELKRDVQQQSHSPAGKAIQYVLSHPETLRDVMQHLISSASLHVLPPSQRQRLAEESAERLIRQYDQRMDEDSVEADDSTS